MTYRDALKEGQNILTEASVPDASIDAWYLLETAADITRAWFLAHDTDALDEQIADRYSASVKKRAERIPLQQITGEQEFMGLRFFVNEHVLIPRQDTETLVEETLKVLKPGMRVLDMCTGSGCILISLLKFCSGTTGVGADISEEALKVAKKNALANACETEASFIRSDMFGELERSEAVCSGDRESLTEKRYEQFDVIVSNPPYIAKAEIENLMTEVKDHEPIGALDGGEDGLDFYRILAEKAMDHLVPGGYFLAEIGYDQGVTAASLFEDRYTDVRMIRDLCGNPRVITARKPLE